MDNELQLFLEKAETYLVCYNEACLLSAECLRRKLASYVPNTRCTVECVNPDYVAAQQGQCVYYRPSAPVAMHKGLTRFYDQIPERIARSIRRTLVYDFGNSNYYRYRNGELTITPDIEKRIKKVCLQNGWTADLVFDEELYDYDW